MQLKIEGNKFTITGELDSKPSKSASGKSEVLASTRGFMTFNDDKGGQVQLSMNLTKKIPK